MKGDEGVNIKKCQRKVIGGDDDGTAEAFLNPEGHLTYSRNWEKTKRPEDGFRQKMRPF